MEEPVNLSPLSLPLSTDLVGGIVFTRANGKFRVLLLQRREDDRFAPGSYQILYGHREKEESVVQTLLRETEEETGLPVASIWTLSETLTFYEHSTRHIYLVPVFGIEVSTAQPVKIDPQELAGYLWCELDEALRLLPWPSQRRVLSSLWTLMRGEVKPFMKLFQGVSKG